MSRIPRIETPPLRAARIGWLALLALLSLSGLAPRAAGGPGQSASYPEPSRSPADVIVLVIPTAPDAARVGLAYRTRVPHERVRREVARLLSQTGWSIGSDLVIKDESVQPGRPAKFPVTTGAMFSLRQAPQVENAAPALMAYLRAFQAWNTVEVMFGLPDLVPYRGPERFDSDAFSVRLFKADGVYRYEAAIRDHTRALPAPSPPPESAARASSTSAGGTAPSAAAAPTSTPWPWILFLAGAGLTGGVGAYLFLTRRAPTSPSARTLRQ